MNEYLYYDLIDIIKGYWIIFITYLIYLLQVVVEVAASYY